MVNAMSIREMPVGEIKVGPRIRADGGDLEGMAQSIRKYGLLHPIVVDQDGNLVSGARRLAAMRDILNWEQVPVREYGELSELERLEIELEENSRRLDLTPAERTLADSRRFELIEMRLAAERKQAAEAEAALAAEQAAEQAAAQGGSDGVEGSTPEGGEGFAQLAQNPTAPAKRKGGRPAKAQSGVPDQDVADEAGVDRRTVQRVREHKAYLDKYGSTISHLTMDEGLAVGKVLDELDAKMRKEALKRVDAELPPHRAVAEIQKALREIGREQRDREQAKMADGHAEEIARNDLRRSWNTVSRALAAMGELDPEAIAAVLDTAERGGIAAQADMAITWLARLSKAVRPEFAQPSAADGEEAEEQDRELVSAAS